MMHSVESTIWHMAFIIQYGGLVAGTAMVVVLLVATLCELVVEKTRYDRVPVPTVVQQSTDRNIVMAGFPRSKR